MASSKVLALYMASTGDSFSWAKGSEGSTLSTSPMRILVAGSTVTPAMYRAKTFEEAIAKAERLVADGGYGHTASIYIDPNRTDRLDAFCAAMKTCRVGVNTPSSHGGIGDLYNFKLRPSLTLGCGSWGGNSVSENVGPMHLLNIKSVAERRENMLWFRTPQKVYFKKGCLPVALNELRDVLGKKRAFIVTDSFLFQNGYTKPITDQLTAMGIVYTVFSNVQPDPTLANAQEGAKAMAVSWSVMGLV